MLLITFFMLLLNVIAILLVYYCLENMEKKEKIIFIAVAVAIIYILTSLVYWISTNGVEIQQVAELGQNFIVFLFVPINGIVVLPLFAKSYRKYKVGNLQGDKFRNRTIVLGVILLILLIAECSYFRDIQNSVVNIVKNNLQKDENNEYVIEINKDDIDPNLDLNEIAEGGIIYTNEINDNANNNDELTDTTNEDSVESESTDEGASEKIDENEGIVSQDVTDINDSTSDVVY